MMPKINREWKYNLRDLPKILFIIYDGAFAKTLNNF